MIECNIHHDIGSLHGSAVIAEPSAMASVHGDCDDDGCAVVAGDGFVASCNDWMLSGKTFSGADGIVKQNY